MIPHLRMPSRRTIICALGLVIVAAVLAARLSIRHSERSEKSQSTGILRPFGPQNDSHAKEWDSQFFERLLPLHEVKRSPGLYDWMAQHLEPGQTFEEFNAAYPRGPIPADRFIYITLIGEFDKTRKEIIGKTAEFIEVYLGLSVKFTEPIPADQIPAEARRVHPQTGDRQVLSTYVLEKLLIPRRPADAIGLIAFTAEDLWPGEGWNFVFGQASPEDRVGVWSIYRNGDPDKSPEEYKLCLLRTIKTGTHELGHMLGLAHCIYFECNMNGSNHRKESDERPLWLCPVCLRKLTWVTAQDPRRRYKDLENACSRMGLDIEKMFYRKGLEILTAPGSEN